MLQSQTISGQTKSWKVNFLVCLGRTRARYERAKEKYSHRERRASMKIQYMSKEPQIFQVGWSITRGRMREKKSGKIDYHAIGRGLDKLVQENAFCAIENREPLKFFEQFTLLYNRTSSSRRECRSTESRNQAIGSLSQT